jgi:hypothetical protein
MNELAQLVANLGPTGALVLSVVVLGRKLDSFSERLILILETTVKRNTEMLQKVSDRMEARQ